MPSEKIELPPGFIWATATSAFQIEGAANEDGKQFANFNFIKMSLFRSWSKHLGRLHSLTE